MLAAPDVARRDRAPIPTAHGRAAQADKLRDYFLEHDAPPAFARPSGSECSAARAERERLLEAHSRPSMVMEEMPTPRERIRADARRVRQAGRRR